MQLTDYFDIQDESDIRLPGTRVGIETVLLDFLDGFSPEEIAVRYHSLTLEQVYATITYYLQDRAKVDAYLDEHRRGAEQAYEHQRQHPNEAVRRLRGLKQPVR